MRTTFSVEGLAELEGALGELPRATARNVLVRTLREQAEVVAEAGEANAPRLSGKLADSYTVGTKLSRRQKSKHKKESDVEVFVGPTPHPKSVQTEFGNAHQAAHPHLRPAWDSTHRQVLDGITDTLRKEVEKARARLARKAERMAAQMR